LRTTAFELFEGLRLMVTNGSSGARLGQFSRKCTDWHVGSDGVERE